MIPFAKLADKSFDQFVKKSLSLNRHLSLDSIRELIGVSKISNTISKILDL